MPGGGENLAGGVPRRGTRGVSTLPAVVMLTAVMVLAGTLGYAGISAVSRSVSTTLTSCSPPTNPACEITSGLNDVVLTVPFGAGFGQALATTTQGASIPATVAVANGEPVTSYAIYWGDGSNYSGPNPTSNHVYTTQGWYVISAQALVGSTWHDGPKYLFPIDVQPSFQTSSSGFFPTLATSFTNGSSAATQFGWLSGSGVVAVSATYTALSTAVGYTDRAPTLTISPTSGTTQSGLVTTATRVAANYSFTAPGLYYITMLGAVMAPTGTLYQNYTWTVYVAPAGVAPGCGGCSILNLHAKSPHPGQIVYQEVAPGGAGTEDPSVAYDTVSAEPVFNIYQTLVAYNGSSTASFLPQLSLCVPGNTGSDGCEAMFGNPLLVDNATTGAPEFWTFPIDPAARFYDPSSGANWSVYPSDVMFSIARTCSFADLPGVGVQPGWLQCQALLPTGNAGWDSGIHAPYNNTPSNVLSSMFINNSTYCPHNVKQVSNGCITFNAWGGAVPGVANGSPWPFLLELIADPLGGSVEPCGWFTHQGAGVPGFSGTSVSTTGDGPCFLPGSTPGNPISSTDDASWTEYLARLPSTYWDPLQELSLDTPGIQSNVQWYMVGSGPYYLAHQPFEQSVGYTLEQNPAYQAPTGCRGQPNCEPLPGPSHYVAKVTVVYQQTDTVGLEEYRAGTVDFATLGSAETPEMLSLIEEGKIGAFMIPTLDLVWLPFALEFDPSAARTLDPNPLNIPGNFFDYVGLREFLVNAYPYDTIENTLLTTDGIQFAFNYGGAIPQYMGNYYPTNISWPSGDPVANPNVNGSAAWWWAQATNSMSPFYDPELTTICSTSSPCQFPFISVTGCVVCDQLAQDYLPYISALSNGVLAPNLFDLTTDLLVTAGLSNPPGKSAAPFYVLGWDPDYPDPTDYLLPAYYPNATYTLGDAVEEGLSVFTCGGGDAPPGMPASSDSMSALLYWAHQPTVPNACQGNAYATMVWAMTEAAGLAVGPERVLLYNLVEQIANHLALYVYADQENEVATYATWVNPTTMNTNPMVGGEDINTWYLINGNGMTS